MRYSDANGGFERAAEGYYEDKFPALRISLDAVGRLDAQRTTSLDEWAAAWRRVRKHSVAARFCSQVSAIMTHT